MSEIGAAGVGADTAALGAPLQPIKRTMKAVEVGQKAMKKAMKAKAMKKAMRRAMKGKAAGAADDEPPAKAKKIAAASKASKWEVALLFFVFCCIIYIL